MNAKFLSGLLAAAALQAAIKANLAHPRLLDEPLIFTRKKAK